MGTRHLICVVKSGEYKVAQYGQWDGYPSGQGTSILMFLKSVDLTKFSEEVSKLRWVTDEEKENYNEQLKTSRMGLAALFPRFSRDTGSDILPMIYEGKVPNLLNSFDFAGDSLYCEWAYVIDLDKRTFEVYEGFNQSPVPDDNRFKTAKDHTDGYYPVRLHTTFGLDNLPDEEGFLAAFVAPEDETE